MKLPRLVSVAFKSTTAYVAAQILTGIEGGIISSYLIMVKGFSTPEAVAIVTTMMIPVMIIQTVLCYLYLSKITEKGKQ